MRFENWLRRRLRDHDIAIGGAPDGVWGRESQKALKRFQAARNLPVTGVGDPATVAALRAAPRDRPDVAPAEPAPPWRAPWLVEAERLDGLMEIAGPRHSSVIMGWARRLGLSAVFRSDETPWCGLGVAHCIAFALPDEPLPANPLGARNWAKFGVTCEPQPGAVLVFERPGSSWAGHVGFYAGEDGTHFHVRGFNQSNSANVTRIAKSRLLARGSRWPKTVPDPRAGRAARSGAGIATTTNED